MRGEAIGQIPLRRRPGLPPARTASRPMAAPDSPAPACVRWSPPPSPHPRATTVRSGPGPRSGCRTAHQSSVANTSVNHVAIESALTATAIRGAVTVPAAHLGQCLGLQQRGLRRQPQQRNAGSRCRTGLFAHHQHLAHALLQRLDSLAHRRGRHMQPLRAPRRMTAVLDLPRRTPRAVGRLSSH